MKKAFWVLASMILVACQGSDVTDPGKYPGSGPSLGVSDGATGGNADFWFLPPMVASPAGNVLYLDNGFDGSLSPTVVITGPNSYSVSLSALLATDHYAANWKIPEGEASYLITVKVGDDVLGSADVQTVLNSSQLKNLETQNYIPLADGRTLPIKFVIENCALEQDACVSRVINTGEGAVLETEDGGVRIPPQTNGQTVRATITTCPDIPTDLPKKSDCYRVTTEPALTAPLNPPAVVWVCSANVDVPSAQEERYTMYRYDNPPGTTTALPHAHDECDTPPPTIGLGASVKGMLADLLHGRLRSAGRQLATLMGPKVLYATMMLDVGAGGETEGFSDFQLVLPAYMTKCAGDGQTVSLGSAVASKVCVKDVGNQPVEGATVHFATTDGSLSPASAMTDINGEASVTWTPSKLGSNSLAASGDGIGASDFSGPRGSVDPFQPLHEHFGDGTGVDGPEVSVLTGSETFTATVNTLPYGSSGYTYLLNVAGDGHTTWFGSPRPAVSGGVAAPASWYSPSFTPTEWTVSGVAAFGTPGTGTCSVNGNVMTTWPIDTDILVRKTIATSAAGTMTIDVRIDNDVQVWLDGVNITASAGPYSTTANTNRVVDGAAGAADDWFVHGDCADAGNPVFSASVGAGSHVLAVRGADYGVISHLDVRVTFVPTP